MMGKLILILQEAGVEENSSFNPVPIVNRSHAPQNMETKEKLAASTIGSLVAGDYRKAEVFKKYGLDFCCGGGKSVEQACKDKSINQEELIAELQSVDLLAKDSSQDYINWDAGFLADFIVNTHHKYIFKNLPLIDEFAQKVASVHGHANPEVIEIARDFEELAEELETHLQKEERILFPFIKQLAAAKLSGSPCPPVPFGTVANPIRMMESEHDHAGDLLHEIKRLSNNYSPPEHACTTWRVLYSKLEEFEEDLHRHIHLENNILFPKAMEMEAEMR